MSDEDRGRVDAIQRARRRFIDRMVEEAAMMGLLERPIVEARKPGRQPWTRAVFDERYAEAVELAGGDTSDEAVAKHFRGLNADGSRGISPDTLRRYRRRRASGEMPE